MKNLRQGVVVAAATATMVTIGTFAVVGASSTASRAVASGSSLDEPTGSFEGNGPVVGQLPDGPLVAVDPDFNLEPTGSSQPDEPTGSSEPPMMSEPSDSLAPDASDLPIGSEPAGTFPGETDGSEPSDPSAGVVPPGPVIDHVVIASYVHTVAAAGSFAWDVGGGPVPAASPVNPPAGVVPTAYVIVDGTVLITAGDDQTVTDLADGASVPAGVAAQLSALGGVDAAYITVSLSDDVDSVSVVGDAATLEAGTYDVDVNIDHIQPGDNTVVESTGVGTTLYVVIGGTVQLGDGTSAAAGDRGTTTNDLGISSNSDTAAIVLTATVTGVDGIATPPPTAVPETTGQAPAPTTTAAATETDTPAPTTVPVCDPNADDPDGDGLSSAIEFADGSDPCDPDSDDDGLSDYDEYHLYIGNPNSPDTDGDGLGDYDEAIVHETQLNNPDTDFDGVSDPVEVAAGTDPNDPNDN